MAKNILDKVVCAMALNKAKKSVDSWNLESAFFFHQPQVPEKLKEKYKK